MQILCLFLGLITIINAAPREKEPIIKILESDDERDPKGKWNYSYQSEDETFREESGVVSPIDDETADLEITGSYKYVNPENQIIEVTYTAGKKGFRPFIKVTEPE